MSERKACVRCERAIDAWSRICPYCNWDQSKPAPPPREAAAPPPADAYKPPEEWNAKKLMAMGGAGVVMLVLAFLIGMVINRDGAPKNAPVPVTEEEQAKAGSGPRRADTPLVPMNEPGGVMVETPITSAPASGVQPGMANEWDRTDATAVSSAEYAQMAKRAQAEKKSASFVDPRSITGAAYAQQSARRVARPPSQSPATQVATNSGNAVATRPIPISQPVPRLFNARGSAKLDLTIGPDGRVRNIHVRRAVAGGTPQLIGAVQQWRFRPATVNGHPVSAPYSVEISFKP